MAYLPSLPIGEFKLLEKKLCDILQGWKDDARAWDWSVANNRDLVLKMKQIISPNDPHGYFSSWASLVTRPRNFTIEQWNPDTAFDEILRQIQCGEVHVNIHLKKAQTETEVLRVLLNRDFNRLSNYAAERRNILGQHNKCEFEAFRKGFLLIPYLHSNNPLNCQGMDGERLP